MTIDGVVEPGFERVRDAFEANFEQQAEVGAACCLYLDGRVVVDIWGGNKDSDGNPWREDTTAASFSTTKGVISTLVHILVDQGKADYDDPIAKYWPEFGVRGKPRF